MQDDAVGRELIDEHEHLVDVPEELQVVRLTGRDALTVDEAWQRVRAQASRDERAAVATWVIDNSGDPADTVRQVDSLWGRLTAADGDR